jgi:F-box protein 11
VDCPICGSGNVEQAVTCNSCGIRLDAQAAALSHVLPAGTKLHGGDYTIGKLLGQGGFGITYLGSDTKLRRPVAIKEFYLSSGCTRHSVTVQPVPSLLSESSYTKSRDNFIGEGQTLARFRHPGIVGVYATFEENNTAYIVMEFLKGKSLQKIIDSNGAISIAEAMRHFAAVAEALQVVHAANVLHLDIKPENIVVCEDGRAVLLDFGISKECTSNLTQTNPGYTDGYAPLEQYGSRSRRAPTNDIYALGATMYCALTGQCPVSAVDRASGIELQPPAKLRSNVPQEINDAVLRAMAISVADRPQTVRKMQDAMEGKQATSAGPAQVRTGNESGKKEVAASPQQPIGIPIRCPYCGHTGSVEEAGEVECSSCNMSVIVDSAGRPERIKCAGCGKLLPAGVAWCPDCNS